MGRKTGFTPAQKRDIITRDGECIPCKGRCGTPPEALTVHHRKNRQSGGSRRANVLPNGIASCWSANGRMESDARFAEVARLNGWKLYQYEDPELVPVWVESLHARVWLTPDGDYREEEP